MPDISKERAAEFRAAAKRGVELLEEKLRPYLRKTMATEPVFAVMLALQYELTSIICEKSETEEEALRIFETSARLARNQIEEFGVGRPHP